MKEQSVDKQCIECQKELINLKVNHKHPEICLKCFNMMIYLYGLNKIAIPHDEYIQLKRLHNNVQSEIKAIKDSIPTIKHHVALDHARCEIERLEELYE